MIQRRNGKYGAENVFFASKSPVNWDLACWTRSATVKIIRSRLVLAHSAADRRLTLWCVYKVPLRSNPQCAFALLRLSFCWMTRFCWNLSVFRDFVCTTTCGQAEWGRHIRKATMRCKTRERERNEETGRRWWRWRSSSRWRTDLFLVVSFKHHVCVAFQRNFSVNTVPAWTKKRVTHLVHVLR